MPKEVWLNEHAMQKFGKMTQFEVQVPHQLNYFNRAVLLCDLSLSMEMTAAINCFLLQMSEANRKNPADFLDSYRIEELVLDSCTHTDEALANLLNSLERHKQLD